jgi:hypothetical protein
MTVDLNLIAYTRDIDGRLLYILKKNQKNRTNWKTFYLGNTINLKEFNLYQTKNLIFLQDENTDFKLMHISVG